MSATTEWSSSPGNDIRYLPPDISSLCVSELDLVRGVLKVMQGLSSSLFYWDDISQSFCILKGGLCVSHLSRSSLHNLVHRFLFPATCLRLVTGIVSKVELELCAPTLRAFAHGVSQWLTKMQDIALMEEINMCKSDATFTPTLLALTSSLSSLCSSAEYLLHIVHGAIPSHFFQSNSPVSNAEMVAHVVDYLFRQLDEVCLIQGGEAGQPYQMVLHLMVGSLLPLIEALDSWISNGILDDPFEEVFFYSNTEVSTGDSEFWEKSYLLRQAPHQKLDARDSSLIHSGSKEDADAAQPCPFFLKDIAKSIVSAGKSLQLIHQVYNSLNGSCAHSEDSDFSDSQREASGFTLSEIFCLSVAGLVGNHDHVFRYLSLDDMFKFVLATDTMMPDRRKENMAESNGEVSTAAACSEKKTWCWFYADALQQKNTKLVHLPRFLAGNLDSSHRDDEHVCAGASDGSDLQRMRPSSLENPVFTVCESSLGRHMESWRALNSSRRQLPPLDDGNLHEAVSGRGRSRCSVTGGTDYASGLPFGERGRSCADDAVKLLEAFFPFPTILPPYQEETLVSKLLPLQNNSTLASKVLEWMLKCRVQGILLCLGLFCRSACLSISSNREKFIDMLISHKFYPERESCSLGTTFICSPVQPSDLLQHFLVVVIGKLDKGENWDDDFELNTILQESIRNSADGLLLSAPESLVVSITNPPGTDDTLLHRKPNSASTAPAPRVHSSHSGADYLQLLAFTCNIPWPLGLIVNAEAIRKYNQFLDVGDEVFIEGEARKIFTGPSSEMDVEAFQDRGAVLKSRRYSWMLEQKLLHFVDAFHQYVMDRVYHNEWRELCVGMKAAGSLDEAIEVHDAYLLSIQRQCFLVPDKLWALIASRINTVLGLALDFHAAQQLCGDGGATSASRARFRVEFDRIEKQFDECVGFLLRVLSFKLNVGNFPHLSDLVSRINYNYFFLPDSESPTIPTNPAAAAVE